MPITDVYTTLFFPYIVEHWFTILAHFKIKGIVYFDYIMDIVLVLKNYFCLE